MTVTKRFYSRKLDYDKVYQLLVDTYERGGQFINWHPSRWEYMHFHPYYQDKYTEKSGVWEADGKIVAIVHNELGGGEAFFTVHPDFAYLKREMLTHAEENLAKLEDGVKKLRVNANEFDEDLNEILRENSYQRKEDDLQYFTPTSFDPAKYKEVELPEGFTLRSLQENNDLNKVDRVLWRGFNHQGEPPADGPESRELMQSAPNFRKDLTIVVEAPDKQFVSFVGMWLCDKNKVAYVEPVCTDPDYRKMGFGKAALMESIRRCSELGAKEVIVESSIPFYLSIGFVSKFIRYPWDKEL